MSRKYKDSCEVPLDVLCKRLEELSYAVTKGRDSVKKEFTMSIPAEVDRDADIVICEAAIRLKLLVRALDLKIGATSYEDNIRICNLTNLT